MAYELRRMKTVDWHVPSPLLDHSHCAVVLHAACVSAVQSSSGVSTLPAHPAEMTYSKKYTRNSWDTSGAMSLVHRQYRCRLPSVVALVLSRADDSGIWSLLSTRRHAQSLQRRHTDEVAALVGGPLHVLIGVVLVDCRGAV